MFIIIFLVTSEAFIFDTNVKNTELTDFFDTNTNINLQGTNVKKVSSESCTECTVYRVQCT